MVQTFKFFLTSCIKVEQTLRGEPALERVAIQIMSLMSPQNMVILDFLMSPSPTDRVRLLWLVGGCAPTDCSTSKQVKRFGSSASVTSPSAASSDRGHVGQLSTPACCCCSGWPSRAVERRGWCSSASAAAGSLGHPSD